jgi:hypothetical protein
MFTDIVGYAALTSEDEQKARESKEETSLQQISKNPGEKHKVSLRFLNGSLP